MAIFAGAEVVVVEGVDLDGAVQPAVLSLAVAIKRRMAVMLSLHPESLATRLL